MNNRDSSVPLLNDEELKAKLEASTAPKVTPEQIDTAIVKEQYHRHDGTTLITCVLTLKNGFTVTGESACADPTNFKEDIGRTNARRNARDKIWSLEGYALRNKLALLEGVKEPTGFILLKGAVQTYLGTKVVHAVAMTRGEYVKERGWDLPENENGDDPGYLVQYVEGGQPNVEGYTGYISWSPQDVFEKSYTTGVVLKQTTYLERMGKELHELNDKIGKLTKFLDSELFKTGVDADEKADLHGQLKAMTSYSAHLAVRLQRAAGAKVAAAT